MTQPSDTSERRVHKEIQMDNVSRNGCTTDAVRPSAHPEMVERIALRLWMQEVRGVETDFYRQPSEIRRYWRDAARIAIEALREPTPQMMASAVLSGMVTPLSGADFALADAALKLLPATAHPERRVVLAEIARDHRAQITAALHGQIPAVGTSEPADSEASSGQGGGQ